MGIKTVQDTSLTSVANAIRVKAEISGTLEFPDEFVSAIQNISTGITPSGTKTITENGTYDVTNFASADVNVSGGGGGASVPPKEVNFYDYDGTVVDSYTASEFASLSAMPANPTHTGLTAQGWNWSLADAKAYVAKYGRLNIGQMYVTTSGDTEIDIQLGIGRNKPYLGCCPNGTVEIDWGDGSAHDTLTGTSTSTLKSIQHIYPDTGEMFTIKLHMDSGSLGFKGYSSSSTGSQVIYNGDTGQTNGQRAYQNAVKAVRCGSHVTSIGDYTFQNCYSLASVTIPDGVTSIGSSAFNYCRSFTHLIFEPTTPPTAGSSAFANLPSDLVVYVPVGTLSAYQAASNYSSIASKMVEMSA